MYRNTYTKPSSSYVTSYRSGVDSEPRRITPPNPALARNEVKTSTSALGMSISARTWSSVTIDAIPGVTDNVPAPATCHAWPVSATPQPVATVRSNVSSTAVSGGSVVTAVTRNRAPCTRMSNGRSAGSLVHGGPAKVRTTSSVSVPGVNGASVIVPAVSKRIGSAGPVVSYTRRAVAPATLQRLP